MLVKDKVAIVTGGSRGLGKAIAMTLVKEGARVSIWGRTPEPLEQAAKGIRAEGGEVLAIRTDVSDSAQVNNSVQKVLDTWGKIDILVNNAGVLPQLTGLADPSKANPFLDMTDESWAEEIATDLSGVFYCMRAVIKPMIEQHSGRIINIGSLAGVAGGYFSTPAYSASKAGLMGMSMLAARWLGKYGITINVVNPGPIMTEGAAFGPSQLEALGKTIPFRRGGVETEVLGKPEDIANAVLYFASDLSSFVTGTRINVLGGQHMG
ncbi:MAG: 3-oxoacyl-ACP reductase FabG [Chloroflexi bacterium]|nr:3-oxoacyl-ACP reductase FabG [Chloroflexota bacterium]